MQDLTCCTRMGWVYVGKLVLAFPTDSVQNLSSLQAVGGLIAVFVLLLSKFHRVAEHIVLVRETTAVGECGCHSEMCFVCSNV